MIQPEVSVLIPTYNRAPILRTTLIELTKQRRMVTWEILVIDNASSDETPKICEELRRFLPIIYLREPVPGKSRALNRGIEAALGKLLVFTDDDVTPLPDWVSELVRAASRYQAANVFCGPVTPVLECEAPEWMFASRFAPIAFSLFIPPVREGFLPPPWVPFGPNFAIRAPALIGMRLRQDLGPMGSNDSFMSEDTEFMERFRKRGDQFVYVPTAGVTHRVRNDLLDVPFLLDRAFMLGRSQVIWKNDIKILPPPDSECTDANLEKYEFGTLLSYYFGQLCEHVIRYGAAPDKLIDAIAGIKWSGDRTLLARRAVEWLTGRPEYIPEYARKGFAD